MLLRELFEAEKSVGLIFGRFNPPHKGHKAAWEMASENAAWYVGTNKSTQGPKDPLPYDVKIKAMETIWPGIKGHIVPHQSWLTLAGEIYKKHGDVELKIYTDEEWVFKTLSQYNGKEGPHGSYNFSKITPVATPRLSSATALRKAVADGDKDAFADAAGVPADTKVDGKPFFDLVAEYLGQYKKEGTERTKEMAAYKGNLGMMELFKFYQDAKANGDDELLAKVEKLIDSGQDKLVWKIVQDYTGTKLVGKEFEYESIAEMIVVENSKLETESCKYGRYWCSTDNKYKCRQGPKQSRSS